MALHTFAVCSVTIGAVICTKKTINYYFRCTRPSHSTSKPIPFKRLHKSATLAYLAYKEPHDVSTIQTDVDEFKCVSDICIPNNNPVYLDGMPFEHAQGYVWIVKETRTVFVAFRGTEDFKDLKADIDVRYADLGYNRKVHMGFWRQFESIRSALEMLLQSQDDAYDTIIFCGHSLAGAIATIASPYFAECFPKKIIKCHTIGSPRVGNKQFCSWFNKKVHENWRVFNENDPIAMVPISNRFMHVDNAVCIRDSGSVDYIESDVPWFARIFQSVHNIDFGLDIFDDHDCKLYMSRLSAKEKGI